MANQSVFRKLSLIYADVCPATADLPSSLSAVTGKTGDVFTLSVDPSYNVTSVNWGEPGSGNSMTHSFSQPGFYLVKVEAAHTTTDCPAAKEFQVTVTDPTPTGTASGDPHFKTFSGEKFDFQ